MKHGKDSCETPRLNARRFEEMVVGKIRSNVLTDGNIRALVKVVDEQMDGVAAEQRERLETIEDELEDVKRKLGRIWHFVENVDDIDMADASARIREHRDRQERLEDEAADARAILSQRRAALDDVETIAAYAQDMSEFLKKSELIERRAFIETFVKEIVVVPGNALMRYTIPMPEDSRIPGRNAEDMALNGSVLSTVKNGGASMRGRTALTAVPSRFFSETSMVITWCLRATRELSIWVSVSRSGRTGGRTASAKWASTSASRASVLASFPVALAKSRTCRGLTTATGRDAAARAATRESSMPPEDSSNTITGAMDFSFETS